MEMKYNRSEVTKKNKNLSKVISGIGFERQNHSNTLLVL